MIIDISLQLFNILCLRLFGYYRENKIDPKVFTLQYVPSLIYSYLSAVAQGDKKVKDSIHIVKKSLNNCLYQLIFSGCWQYANITVGNI